MKKFLKEFQEFAIRGNVMDLAVAVVIGGAFGKIVTSLVNDIIMPLMGILLGGIDFTTLKFTFGEAILTYGNFIQTIVDFVIIALCIFLAVKVMGAVIKKKKADEKKEEKKVTKEVELLTEIRDLLKKNR
ncbi:MAG: large conductance mechanosensitive channel protein MscL [Parcubacteria group bacterium]|jgi:large conductance mechanosensitive channel